MKRLLIAAALLTSTAALGQPPPPQIACAAVSYGPPLNLRTYPNGPLIAAYWPGTQVIVDGANGGNWVHVIIGPAAGWMFAPYLVPISCPLPPPMVDEPLADPGPAAPPPPELSMQEEREQIIRQGEEHCRRFPNDTQVCHPAR